ncbi:GNAT family N-acetyltransferase [Leptothrix discophora]|uniref:GNAT family N-acetyltransferase n=1 Tax=Leptothrix discophora TaxID=89 RepID=A0ABT9G986_LEPDI|nr:GNAT family N-acetyltransferase [Leptothrix discophora]MDP4302778.1 GNAT family N-acetyltransferase [Leptothrix discophora]
MTAARTTTDLIAWPEMLARHRTAWLQLWRASGAVPDLGPTWAEALVSGHRIDPSELHVLVGWSDDARAGVDADADTDAARLRWVWPLRRRSVRRAGLRWSVLGPLNNVYTLHSGLLCAGGDEASAHQAREQAWTALQRQPLRWDWFEVDSVVAGSAEHAQWQALAARDDAGLRSVAIHRSPYLRHEGTLDALITQRSRNFREKIRARRRELQRGCAPGGALAWRQYTRPEEMDAYFALARQVELHSWKHAEGTAITSREWETGFYASLLPGLAAEGQTVCTVLFQDGLPVGHSIDLRCGARVYGVKWTYDMNHARLRPGVLLMVGRLDQYLADGVTEFDFLGEAEAYKLQWTATTRDHLRLRLHAASPRGRLARALDDVLARLKSLRRHAAPPAAPATPPDTADAGVTLAARDD